MWIKEFKIAFIEENISKLLELIDTMPQFDSLHEMQEAQALIIQAHDELLPARDKAAKNLQELKKSKEFLQATHDNTPYKLDISS